MGAAWAAAYPAARETFAEADEVLGFALSRLCLEGPAEELQLTANTQPALLTASVAIHRAVAAEGLAPAVVAGHSLGEYSALVAAGALGFADALRLVRRRGEAMQEAVPAGVGAMAAILGLDAGGGRAIAADAAAAARRGVRGGQLQLPRADGGRRPRGGGRAGDRRWPPSGAPSGRIALPVSAPFHCALMAPAERVMAELLAATEIARPGGAGGGQRRRPAGDHRRRGAPGAGPPGDAARCAGSSRCWRMAAGGIDTFVEVGPGKVLTGLIRRIAPEAATASVGEIEDYRKFQAARRAARRRGDERRTDAAAGRPDGPGHRGLAGDRRGGRPPAGGARGRGWCSPPATRRSWRPWRRRSPRPAARALPWALDVAAAGGGRAAGGAAGGVRRDRHPGQQRRHHRRQPAGADEPGGLAAGDRPST